MINQVDAIVSKLSTQHSSDDKSKYFSEGSPTPLAYGVIAAAAALDLSRSRIYELIAAGEIAICKIGKRTIIPTGELTAFLERHRVSAEMPKEHTITRDGR